jgi:Ca2+ transporting ATPase
LPAVEVPALAEVSRVCTLCNEAALKYTPALPAAEGSYSKVGTATEAALLVLGEKLGVSDEAACRRMLASGKDALLTPAERVCAASSFWRSRQTIQQYLEFRRDRKSMSVIVRDAAGTHSLLCKGAPESILPRCTTTLVETGVAELTAEGQASIQAQADAWAAQGLRVLALAKIEVMSPQALGTAAADDTHFASIESRMTFVGLVGMLDPPRPEVRDAIATCMQAGIRVIVITGDNPRTAEAICRRIGIFDEHENLEDDTSSIVPSSDSVALQVGQRYKKSFTGAEFSALSESAQSECVRRARLFSRVEPTHKLRLVELLQAQTGAQNVVAMTGDGVNDAAVRVLFLFQKRINYFFISVDSFVQALQRSDIGIAMGSGTAVAREASKMVLQDDNFATIVMAVAEGRAIYANTRQFIRYLISSNIGEVVCIFATAALGMPEALIPVQLLWVNLVTDGLPATALGFNPPDADSMSQPPRGRSDRIVDTWTLIRYLVIGFYIGAGTVAGFVWYYMYYALGPQVTWQQLTHFHACAGSSTMFEGVDCSVFQARGEHWPHASTVALSVLVVIEMFNALNALSENQSILSVPPSTNKWVLAAIALSMALHFLILYVPFLQTIFAVAPLSTAEWWAVVLISFPVILVDEVLKFASRRVCAPIALLRRRRQMHNGDDDEPQIPLSAVEYSWSNIRSRLFQRSQRFGSVSAGGSAYKPLSTVELSSSDSGGNTSQPEVVRRR